MIDLADPKTDVIELFKLFKKWHERTVKIAFDDVDVNFWMTHILEQPKKNMRNFSETEEYEINQLSEQLLRIWDGAHFIRRIQCSETTYYYEMEAK
jgi:hypothetical protein